MRYYKKIFITILLLSCSHLALAWNFIGHAVIAQIAYQQLTPIAKKKVDRLVQTFSQVYPDINSYQKMANWNDTVRQDGITEFNSWHFIDKPFSVDGTSLPYYAKENVAWAITQTEASLATTKNTFNQALALAMLTHFVGDITQPLHCATRVTKKNPHGDNGGNLYVINANYANNLHALWDEGLGLFTPSNNVVAQINQLALTIQQQYPPQYFRQALQDNNPYHWADYSFKIAKKFAYSTPEHKTPNDNYIHKGQEIVKRQTAIAGYRLGKIINRWASK